MQVRARTRLIITVAPALALAEWRQLGPRRQSEGGANGTKPRRAPAHLRAAPICRRVVAVATTAAPASNPNDSERCRTRRAPLWPRRCGPQRERAAPFASARTTRRDPSAAERSRSGRARARARPKWAAPLESGQLVVFTLRERIGYWPRPAGRVLRSRSSAAAALLFADERKLRAAEPLVAASRRRRRRRPTQSSRSSAGRSAHERADKRTDAHTERASEQRAGGENEQPETER